MRLKMHLKFKQLLQGEEVGVRFRIALMIERSENLRILTKLITLNGHSWLSMMALHGN
jgi:hypothetical protein